MSENEITSYNLTNHFPFLHSTLTNKQKHTHENKSLIHSTNTLIIWLHGGFTLQVRHKHTQNANNKSKDRNVTTVAGENKPQLQHACLVPITGIHSQAKKWLS